MKTLRALLALGLGILASTAQAGVLKTVQAGAADQTVVIRIVDSTDGTPETGVVFNTSGIDLEYWIHGANAVTDITEATQTVSGAHTDGGFVHLGNGNYRLDLPDAAVATAGAVEIMGTVTGMIVIGGTVQISPPVNVVSAAGVAWASGAITAASIATDAIGAAEIAADAIGASELATDAIGAAEIAASAIGASEIADGGITSTEFGTGAITATVIAADAIGASEVAADVSTELLTGLANLAVNVAQVSGDATAADTFETWLDGTTGPAAPLGIARQGTAQSATSTTLVLDASAPFADDTAIGMTLWACGSTQGYCQARAITDYVTSTDTATVDAWTVTPSGTITYYVFGTAPGGGGSLTASDVWAYATRTLTALDEDSTTIDLNASYVGGVTVFDEDLTTIDINATTLGTVSTATAVTTVNGLAANVITAAATAADFTTEVTSGLATAAALDAVDNYVDTEVAAILDDTGTSGVALAAGAVDAIWDEAQSGHVTAGSFGVYLDSAVSGVSTGGVSAGDIADAVWDELLSGHAVSGSTGEALTTASGAAGLDAAGVRAAIGLATANLDTQLSGLDGKLDTIDNYVDTEVAAILTDTGTTLDTAIATVDSNVDAIKAKTDSLTFTTAGQVDSNVQSVNDVAITGDGSGTPFNVASFRQFKRAYPNAELTRAAFKALRDKAIRDFAERQGRGYIEAVAR